MAEVTSSNTVGYTKLNLTAGLNMIGGQFITVNNADDNTADIQSFVTGTLSTGDEIMFYNGTTYERFSYDADMTFDQEFNVLGAGWNDSDGYRANRDVSPSEGFWYRAKVSTPVTFSGEVSEENSVVETNGGLALTALPKPVSVDIQSITFTGIATGDELLIYSGGTYERYAYDADMTFDQEFNVLGAGWNDSDGYRAVKTIDANTGFWLRAKANTITISVD